MVAAALIALVACGDDGGDGDPQRDAAAVADGSTFADAPGGADASGNATYRALGIVGALDRVAIVKADADADVCAVKSLVHDCAGVRARDSSV